MNQSERIDDNSVVKRSRYDYLNEDNGDVNKEMSVEDFFTITSNSRSSNALILKALLHIDPNDPQSV